LNGVFASRGLPFGESQPSTRVEDIVRCVIYRRENNFNTKSNKTKVVKTPGGRLTVHLVKKAAKGPRCGDCKGKIIGVPYLRPFARAVDGIASDVTKSIETYGSELNKISADADNKGKDIIDSAKSRAAALIREAVSPSNSSPYTMLIFERRSPFVGRRSKDGLTMSR